VAPNTTWCVDFKGHFRMKDGRVCYPLTILDAHTRFLIRCEALLEPTGDAVKEVFDSAFQEYGVPEAIRTDNGPPFACVGAGSLTPLSVWWIKLGIRPERIAPGKPQQNGRQEPPARFYERSPRKYPRKLLCVDREPWFLYQRVTKRGCLRPPEPTTRSR